MRPKEKRFFYFVLCIFEWAHDTPGMFDRSSGVYDFIIVW